jgi:Fe-S cluster assembly protein SufD
LPARIAGFARVVFVDGLHAGSLSDPALPAGVTAGSASGFAATGASAAMLAPDRRFLELNTVFARDELRIAAPAGATLQLEVIFVAATAGDVATGYPGLVVQAGRGASLSLLERHLSTPDRVTSTNHRACIELDAGAQLLHYRLQAQAAHGHCIETVAATLHESATWTLHSLACGAGAARSTCVVTLPGRGARVHWNAAALGDGEQVNDAQVSVEYIGEQTQVRQTYRGIAAGKSRLAFSGRMLVRSTARGADSQQSLRSLLAGPGAEADARPQLEIHTDEVKASHGSTAGKLDEAMLFYLLSRGIERDTAGALLKWAFIADLVARIEVPGIRLQFQQHVAASLRDLGIAGDLASAAPASGVPA